MITISAPVMRRKRRLDNLMWLLATVGCTGLLACASAHAMDTSVADMPEQALTEGAAWQLADEAYKAYDSKDYAVAQKKAEQALALRPDVPRLWLLLVYALQNQNKLEEALRIAQQAVSAGHRSSELIAARDALQAMAAARTQTQTLARQTRAWQLADSAYKAYATGHLDKAERDARQSLKLNPNDTRLRSLLVYTLEKEGRLQDAFREASLALTRDPKNSELQILRDRSARQLARAPAIEAWSAYQKKDYASAIALANKAVDYASDVHSYQYLLIIALLNTGQYLKVEEVATQAIAQDPDDAISLALRGYARTRLNRTAQAQADFTQALAQDWLSDSMHANLACIAASDGKQCPRINTDAPDPILFCTADATDVLCNVLAAGSSLGQGSGPGYEEAGAAYKAYGEHDYAKAVSHARLASTQAPENMSYRLLLINSLALSGQTEQAREAMRPLLEADALPPDALLDAAYAAQRLGYNERASAWFSSTIDAEHAGRIQLEPQAAYNIRRAVTELERSWGVNTALGYGTMGVENASFAPALSARRSMQASSEIYWRPPGIGSNDGRILELYARAGQTLYDGTGGTTGASTLQGTVGARWKPFSKQNFVFAVEHLFPIGALGRTDWLLRAAWSDGEGGDLRVDTPHWRYWQVYVEADRFLQTPQDLGAFEARYGRSFLARTISSRLVATPFVSLAANYDSKLETPSTLGIGPGIGLRYWFREDMHHAPASFVDMSVQYRFRLTGADRSNGIFASLYFSY